MRSRGFLRRRGRTYGQAALLGAAASAWVVLAWLPFRGDGEAPGGNPVAAARTGSALPPFGLTDPIDGVDRAGATGTSMPTGQVGIPASAQEFGNVPYSGRFTFVRIRFGSSLGRGRGFGREPPWAHDFPFADNNFVRILDEVTLLGPQLQATNVLSADDPELLNHPVAYLVEPAYWSPTPAEITGLEAYLRKGGFLIVDDFRSSGEWARFEAIMAAVLPEGRLVPLDLENPIFHAFFEIETLDFQPPTFRQFRPQFMGIYEDNDPDRRLMVVANFNNDIGDYWEYSDMGYFPIDLSNEAYKVGVNYIIYALTR